MKYLTHETLGYTVSALIGIQAGYVEIIFSPSPVRYTSSI